MIRESELGEQFASDCVIRQPVWQLKGSCESCAHLQQLPKDDRSTERPGRHVALESGFATGSQVYGTLYQYRRYKKRRLGRRLLSKSAGSGKPKTLGRLLGAPRGCSGNIKAAARR